MGVACPRHPGGAGPDSAQNFPLHNAGLTKAEQFGSRTEYLGAFIASRPAGGVK